MAHYQYAGDDIINIRLDRTSEKIKVSPGEIIESKLPKLHFTANGFKEVIETEVKEDGKDGINVEVVKTGKAKK